MMRREGLAFAFCGLASLLALSGGCASVGPATSAAGAEGFPDWVLVVPPPNPERACYVGSCAAAPDTGIGIGEAEADARAQAGRAARERIVPLVDDAFQDAGVETEALDRAHFRVLVIEPVVDRLAAALRRERVFYRPCATQPAAADAVARICDVFVLMTVDVAAWDRLPIEVMADLRKKLQSEAGDAKAVGLLDWMLRHYGEADPGVQPGGRGSEGP
jgi:hypothetical protein